MMPSPQLQKEGRIHRYHCTPVRKYSHDDSHATKDGVTNNDDNETGIKRKKETINWHLTGKNNTFAGMSTTNGFHP